MRSPRSENDSTPTGYPAARAAVGAIGINPLKFECSQLVSPRKDPAEIFLPEQLTVNSEKDPAEIFLPERGTSPG